MQADLSWDECKAAHLAIDILLTYQLFQGPHLFIHVIHAALHGSDGVSSRDELVVILVDEHLHVRVQTLNLCVHFQVFLKQWLQAGCAQKLIDEPVAVEGSGVQPN